MPDKAEEDIFRRTGKVEQETMIPSEQKIWQLAEASAAGTLSGTEEQELRAQLAADPSFALAFQECVNMLQSLKDSRARRQLRSELAEIHKEITVSTPPARHISFYPRHLRTAAVAAGIALLTSLTTVWTMRHREPKLNTTGNIELLRRLPKELNTIKQSQNQQQQQIQSIKNQLSSTSSVPVQSKYNGTGFALSNDGYIVTSYHVMEGADSIYIQTRNGSYHRARIIAYEPKADVAVLKVEDEHFRFGKGELPYNLAPAKLALGARIYTLGFPQDEIVYNEGYISSRNGYEGDSSQYRLEVPANPGQSGAPVLDEDGNVVGIIRSRDLQSEGTTYAVSSKTLLRLLHDLPKDAGLHLARGNRLTGLSREAQIEKLQDYTCTVKVY